MHRATRVITYARPNIEDPELSITACRRADLVAAGRRDLLMDRSLGGGPPEPVVQAAKPQQHLVNSA